MPRAFDYVRSDSDHIFIVGSDQEIDGYLYGQVVYEPDENGSRELRGVNYSKADRSSTNLSLEYTRTNNIFQDGFIINKDSISDIRTPDGQLDRILEDGLDDWEVEAYDVLDDLFGGEVYLIGSQIWGLSTEDSDVDILLCSNDRSDFEDIFSDFVEETGYELLGEQALREKSGKYADRFGISEESAFHHLSTPNRRVMSMDNGEKLSLIASQELGMHSDFDFPDSVDDEGSEVKDSGIVTDASSGHMRPRVYELDLERLGNVTLVSDRWIDAGSFSEGDRVSVGGDYFPGIDTVFLSRDEAYFELSEIIN